MDGDGACRKEAEAEKLGGEVKEVVNISPYSLLALTLKQMKQNFFLNV